jgi:hypothetical protein
MYERSRKMLIFLVVTFLALKIVCVAITAMITWRVLPFTSKL